MEETVTAKWSQVENVYQRRSDLIPNLVNTVKTEANFEKSTLEAVIQARASATQVKIDPTNLTPESMKAFEAAQGQLGTTLSRLLVTMEQYPNLKSNEAFNQLMSQLEGTENRITVERREFNIAVQDYNKYIRRFPKNVWAGMFGFQTKAYFQADKGAEKTPTVNFDK
jgi:LemA protein